MPCLSAATPIALAGPRVAAPSREQDYDLRAGRLIDAIIAIGREAGISIATAVPRPAAIRTRRVVGRMTVDAALRCALAGTGLVAVRTGPQTFRIERGAPSTARAPSPSPPPPHSRPEASFSPAPVADVVVTAGKQRNPLDLFPGSAEVVRLDSSLLRHRRDLGTQALADALPVLTSTSLGPGREKLFLRGVADSSFAGASQATVGQYLGEVQLNYNAPDPNLSLYDMDRVEVLQGPQGTLYGAGSLGGVIRLHPTPPVVGAWQAGFQSALGGTWHGGSSGDVAGAINVPLGNDAGLRVVGYGSRSPGYIDDLRRGLRDVNGTRTVGARAAVRLEAGGGWTIDFGGTWQIIANRDAQYVERTGHPLSRAVPVAEPSSNRVAIAQLGVRKDWADGKELVGSLSLVGNRLSARYAASAQTGRIGDVVASHNQSSLAAGEVRLSTSASDGTGWVAGVHVAMSDDILIYRLIDADAAAVPLPLQDVRGNNDGPASGRASRFLRGIRNRVLDTAAFGQATLALGSRVQVTAGARVSFVQLGGYEVLPTGLEEEYDEASSDRNSLTLAPGVAATWRIGSHVLGYVRYQRGFRIGGYVVVPFEPGDRDGDGAIGRLGARPFRSDTLDMVEAGVRFGRPRQGVSGNLSLSLARWRNIQADLVGPNGLYTSNVGDGRVRGLEANAHWAVSPRLSLSAGLFLADSRLYRGASAHSDERDQALPNIPAVTTRLAIDRTIALRSGATLNLDANLRYLSRSWLGVGSMLRIPQGDLTDMGAAAEYRRGRYSVFIDLRNLLDTRGNRFAVGNPLELGRIDQRTPLQPRTIKIGFAIQF